MNVRGIFSNYNIILNKSTIPTSTFLNQLNRKISSTTTTSTMTQPITIIGAGVIGLSTALELQTRLPQTHIKIIAAEFPSLPSTWSTNATSTTTHSNPNSGSQPTRPSVDYASMWAGAHYRPIRPSASSKQLLDEMKLAVRTCERMLELAREYDERETGVSVMHAMEILERPPLEIMELKTGDVYAGPGDEFRVLSQDELDELNAGVLKRDGVIGQKGDGSEGQARWACSYMAYCINVHVYCSFLLKRFIDNGGEVVRKRLNGVAEAFSLIPSDETIPIIVNASGRNFDTDPKTKIIRGQTVLVRNQYNKTITRQISDGSWSFLIPRPGGAGTVVGGTKEIEDTQEEPRLETRGLLLRNAVKYFPDFVDDVSKFDVIMDNVGRRPWREDGFRIEDENLSLDSGQRGIVVHAYGAGGRGYELSWGVAERTADLVERNSSRHPELSL